MSIPKGASHAIPALMVSDHNGGTACLAPFWHLLIPFVDSDAAERLFRHKVLSFLKTEGLLPEERAALLLSRQHHTGLLRRCAACDLPWSAGGRRPSFPLSGRAAPSLRPPRPRPQTAAGGEFLARVLAHVPEPKLHLAPLRLVQQLAKRVASREGGGGGWGLGRSERVPGPTAQRPGREPFHRAPSSGRGGRALPCRTPGEEAALTGCQAHHNRHSCRNARKPARSVGPGTCLPL
jgi:hypothetical protein